MSNVFSKIGFFFLKQIARSASEGAGLLRIRRRPAAGRQRHRHHRPRPFQRQGHQERHHLSYRFIGENVLDKISPRDREHAFPRPGVELWMTRTGSPSSPAPPGASVRPSPCNWPQAASTSSSPTYGWTRRQARPQRNRRTGRAHPGHQDRRLAAPPTPRR